MSSYSASAATRRGSIVPPLAGIESNAPQNAIPHECDVLISGTGLVESILAASLAWQGTNVLHIDPNNYYGDSSACFNIDQLTKWVEKVNHSNDKIFSNARLYIPRPLESRKYLVDLSTKIMFAKSDLLSLLIKSRVFRYLEFKALGNFHTFENDSFDKVAGSKEDIFTDQSLSLVTKRGLMRFMKFVLDWENNLEIWKDYQNEPIGKFLNEKFKLETQQINELVLSIGLCQSLEVHTPIALSRIKRYLSSIDIYGNFPVLFSMYGSAGEISQGFCRSAAVGGATYKLGTKIVSINEDNKEAILEDGTHVKVNEKIILSSSSDGIKGIENDNTKPHNIITRLIAFVAKDCKEWFAENEQAAIVVFPPSTLDTDNKSAVQAIVLGSGSGQCPEGQAAWYLSTTEQDPTKAHRDLEEAFTKLEKSILRESTEDFEFENIDESDISYRPDGMPVLSSVKLGQSMQSFVPREKLQYLLKLSFIQKVEQVSELDAAIQPDENSTISNKFLLNAPNLLAEISYDGILTQVKNLFTQIVGSDEDFFDVDFEDEESNENIKDIESNGIEGTADQNKMADDDEFGHDMEL